MNGPGSVTVWLDALKAGGARDEAAARLWARYFERLVARARDLLRGRTRAADGEDVALAAFDSFVRAAEGGRFPRLGDRSDLWQVLLMLAARQATTEARAETRQKRGGGRVGPLPDEPLPSDEPGPAEAAALAEGAEELLAALGDDELRRVAVWALEGYTNAEIAAKLGRSVATAERKLSRIRAVWAAR